MSERALATGSSRKAPNHPPCADGLLLEPGSHDEDEQAVDEPRDDEVGSAPRVRGFASQELQEKLESNVAFRFVSRQVDEGTKKRNQRMRTDVLEEVLGAKHDRGLARPRTPECCKTPRHGGEHLLVRSRLGFRTVADRVPDSAANQDDVTRREPNGPPLLYGTQPAGPALNDMDASFRDGVDFESPGRHELRLRDHGRAEPSDGKDIR